MKGPRKLNVVVPAVGDGSPAVPVFPDALGGGALADSWRTKDGKSQGLVNNPPQWSEGVVRRPRRVRA